VNVHRIQPRKQWTGTRKPLYKFLNLVPFAPDPFFTAAPFFTADPFFTSRGGSFCARQKIVG
jgi:hypothetical protein